LSEKVKESQIFIFQHDDPTKCYAYSISIPLNITKVKTVEKNIMIIGKMNGDTDIPTIGYMKGPAAFVMLYDMTKNQFRGYSWNGQYAEVAGISLANMELVVFGNFKLIMNTTYECEDYCLFISNINMTTGAIKTNTFMTKRSKILDSDNRYALTSFYVNFENLELESEVFLINYVDVDEAAAPVIMNKIESYSKEVIDGNIIMLDMDMNQQNFFSGITYRNRMEMVDIYSTVILNIQVITNPFIPISSQTTSSSASSSSSTTSTKSSTNSATSKSSTSKSSTSSSSSSSTSSTSSTTSRTSSSRSPTTTRAYPVTNQAGDPAETLRLSTWGIVTLIVVILGIVSFVGWQIWKKRQREGTVNLFSKVKDEE